MTKTSEANGRVRAAARTVSYLVATRSELATELYASATTDAERNERHVVGMALRGTAEAIAAGRDTWDDLPAQEWDVLANNLRHLGTRVPELGRAERDDFDTLAAYYRTLAAAARQAEAPARPTA